MEWFYLALLSALSLAFADVFSKKYFQGNTGPEMVLVRFLVPGLLLLPMTLNGNYPDFDSQFWVWMAILVPLELLAMWLYWLAIRDSPLYLTLPYQAFTPVFIVITAYIILDESITLQNLTGILLVVSGAYLLNVRRKTGEGGQDLLLPLKSIFYEKGSRLMLTAALVYSVTSVLGKGAVQYVDPETFGAFYFSVIGLVGLVLTLLVRPQSINVLRLKPLPSLLVAFCLSIMVITHFMSVAQIEVAYMISVKRTSLLFGILLGVIFFGEKHLFQHFVAGVIMVVGVAVILI